MSDPTRIRLAADEMMISFDYEGLDSGALLESFPRGDYEVLIVGTSDQLRDVAAGIFQVAEDIDA